MEEKTFDSTEHHKERKAKIGSEAKEKQKATEAEATRVAENKEIAVSRELPREDETREQLLDRIRAMREEKPKEVDVEITRSGGLQKAFEAEQEAGRAAVAKAHEEMERTRALVQQVEAAAEKK